MQISQPKGTVLRVCVDGDHLVRIANARGVVLQTLAGIGPPTYETAIGAGIYFIRADVNGGTLTREVIVRQ